MRVNQIRGHQGRTLVHTISTTYVSYIPTYVLAYEGHTTMFYSARYPKSDWTELSCLPWKYPRPPKRTLSTVEAGRPCDSYTRPRKDDSVVAAAVKVSSEGQWKAEAAHVQKWALIHSRARACDGGGSYRNRSRTKKHTAATSAGGRRRVCPVVVFWVPSSMGASFSADNFTYNRELQYTQGQFDFKLD